MNGYVNVSSAWGALGCHMDGLAWAAALGVLVAAVSWVVMGYPVALLRDALPFVITLRKGGER